MLLTYKAILQNGQVRWLGEQPKSLDKPREISIIFSENEAQTEQNTGKIMAEILARTTQNDISKTFGDAVEWQKEIRRDRNLPGRESGE